MATKSSSSGTMKKVDQDAFDFHHARAMYWYAHVVTGAYKTVEVRRGNGSLLRDDEKLIRALSKMTRHTEVMEEIYSGAQDDRKTGSGGRGGRLRSVG